jgi:hypothetical protein
MTDVTPPGQSKPSDSIEGFYCPRSSRVSFLRKNRSTNDTFQVYIGDLSPDTGNILSIGGVFAYAQERGAQLGEYVYSVVSGEHPEAVFTGSKKQCLKYIRDNAFLGS